MKHQIGRFSVHQTAKTMAFLYLVFGFVYIPLGFLTDSAAAPDASLGWIWFMMPILMAVFGYVIIAIMCALYNFIAKNTGGIEFDLTTEAPGAHTEA